ncbi:3',5'-cyclic-nucleotide phosphodiesterase pde1 [Ciborinia camelliae]|nr:3',5'-cyclic-nucleotide phosphodiesterase pde1 [Ciborinia camelliae]
MADTSFQVIILGAGGGPMENNCTALLVRSLAQGWSKGSVLAVDSGTFLPSIEELLKKYYPLPSGPPCTLQKGILSGLDLPHRTTLANTGHISHIVVGAHLVTHPHLDHISGGIMSTAASFTKPRRIAGLASTIQALKDHIFNDVIWPNLSDENDGAGLVTYMRLTSGGSLVLGEGATKGYTEVVDGLGVKSWAISHGMCVGAEFPYQGSSYQESSSSKRGSVQSQRSRGGSDAHSHVSDALTAEQLKVYTSSAFFIQDMASGQEILIWGDVEPDSISALPRNHLVWADAAPKIAAGTLKGIFIECSFDGSRPDEILFGHLTPRYLIEELKFLATEVEKCRQEPRKKGDFSSSPTTTENYLRKSIAHRQESARDRQAPSITTAGNVIHLQGWRTASSPELSFHYALQGVKVVIIHVKERLDDKENPRVTIFRELMEFEERLKFGCEFVVSEKGMSVHV